jgi:hypothetical protein
MREYFCHKYVYILLRFCKSIIHPILCQYVFGFKNNFIWHKIQLYKQSLSKKNTATSRDNILCTVPIYTKILLFNQFHPWICKTFCLLPVHILTHKTFMYHHLKINHVMNHVIKYINYILQKSQNKLKSYKILYILMVFQFY